MKNVGQAFIGLILAIFTIIAFKLLFIHPCGSYSGKTEQIPETRCKCLGKAIDFDNYLGDPEVFSSKPHYDQCVGIVYKRTNL